jgi:plasmid replication initiation protein
MFEIEQKKYSVVQSNPLVNAQYKLDLIEQKVLRYIISMITPHDETLEKKFYRIQIKELEEFLGWVEEGGKIFNYIKRVADKLKITTIRVKKPGTTIVTSWIASYEYPENKGWIEFELSSKLESELLQLKKQFTQYYLKNISKLKSQYSIRIYELLKEYASIGKREESIESLRMMLGLQNEYKEYRDLKRRILEPAYKEINQKTDISFIWKPLKEARKVIGIIFYDIEQKTFISNWILSLIPKRYQDNRQVLNVIRKYLTLFGKDYVVEKLRYTNSRHPKKWIDYFFKVCEYNYGEGYTPNQDNETYIFVENPQAKATAEKIKKEKEFLKKVEEEYFTYKSKTVEDYLASWSASELEELKENFKKSLRNNFLRTMLKEKGFDSFVIKAEYIQFVYENYIPPQARISFLDFSKDRGSEVVVG